MLEPVVMAQF